MNLLIKSEGLKNNFKFMTEGKDVISPEWVVDPNKAYEMGHAMNPYYTMAANVLKVGNKKLAEKLMKQGDDFGGIAEKKFDEKEEAVNELIVEVTEKIMPSALSGGRANLVKGGYVNQIALGNVLKDKEKTDLFVERLKLFFGATKLKDVPLGGEVSTRYVSAISAGNNKVFAFDIISEKGDRIPQEIAFFLVKQEAEK